MKRIKRTVLFAAALLALTSCLKPVVSVNADFITDKEVYELYEEVMITNTSEAINDIIVACKWEWGSEHVWGKQLEKPISFDTVGEKEITLTVVTDSNVSGTCTKTITVQDSNKRPVADFSYTPASGIMAGDEVQFTDKSSDPDGSIVAWEWKIGATTVTEQNPKVTLNEPGEIEVTLTVTDNQRGKASVTKVIKVEKNQNSMELLWATAYDSDSEARVVFTSPAVSPDGKTVYAFSSGNLLTAVGTNGKPKWSFNAGIHNPATTKNFSTCTPSVDEDGTIYLVVGNKDAQDKTGATQAGIYAVNPDGKQKWYYGYAYGWFINVIPIVLKDHLFVYTKRNPSVGDNPELWPGGGADNGLLLYKGDGSYFNYLLVKRGSHGGGVATKDENMILHTDTKYGTRVYWKQDGNWKHAGPNAGQDAYMLGYIGAKNTEIGFTSYMAVDGNKVYIVFGKADGAGSTSAAAELFCYDLGKYDKSAGATPEWMLDLEGENKMYYSLGAVIGGDGTIFATSSAGVTAVSPNGTKKWFAPASSGCEIWGSPAVDKNGFVYVTETATDQTSGKLVKINPEGVKVSELTLGQAACSSPTIGPDGTIYCTSTKDSKPTLSAIKGTASGPAAGWSQLGGGYRKTCKAE